MRKLSDCGEFLHKIIGAAMLHGFTYKEGRAVFAVAVKMMDYLDQHPNIDDDVMAEEVKKWMEQELKK